MNIFDFEKRLKNHADNSRGEVDMNRLLTDLNIKPQGTSYRKFIYFFISGIALVGLSYFTYSYLDSGSQDDMRTASITAEPESLNTTSKAEEKNIILNENPISENRSTSTVHKNATSSNTNIFRNITNSATPNRPVNTNTNSKINNTIKSTSQTTIEVKEAKTNFNAPSKLAPATKNTLPREAKIIAATKSPEPVNNAVANTYLDRQLETVNLLPTHTFRLSDGFDSALGKKKTTCPQFSERLWHMYIIPEVGYTFPMKTLSLNDEDARFVFDERVANETTIEGINASLFLQFKNQITGLYVKPGVSYSRFTERIDFVKRDIEIDTSSVTTIIRDTNGDIISEITEEVITENERVTRSRVHYQLHEFELPVALGYSINLNQFAIDIEAGIKLNFLQRATGQILSTGAEFIDLGSDDVDLFKNSVGLGFFGGILLKKQLNSRTELYLAPRFSFNTLAYSSNSNPINQQYTVLGLHAGLIHAIY